MNKYLVYMHTSPCGKAYIGRTRNYARRSRDHKNQKRKTEFSLAIQTIGWNNFKHEILKDDLTLEEANFWEKFYIDFHNTLEPNGFNFQTGGIDCKYSENAKRKISDTNKGKTSPRKGVKLSDETKNKIGNANRGRIKSLETCSKIAKANTGKKHTDAHKEYMRKKMKGRKFSPETIKRMSEAAIKRNSNPEVRKNLSLKAKLQYQQNLRDE